MMNSAKEALSVVARFRLRRLRWLICPIAAVSVLFLTVYAHGQSINEETSVVRKIRESLVFAQPVVSVGDGKPNDDETLEVWAALQAVTGMQAGTDVRSVEKFLQAHPNSTWAPSLHTGLGSLYRETGRYTLALEHWESAWQSTKQFDNGDGKAVADYALVSWLTLLSSLGRVETMEKLIAEVGNWKFDNIGLQSAFMRCR